MIDIPALLNFMNDHKNFEIGREAARFIGVDGTDWEERVAASIVGAIAEYRAGADVQSPGGREIIESIERAAEGAALLSKSLKTILAGRVRIPANGGERGQMRKDLAQLVIGTVTETLGVPDHNWVDDGLNWPLAQHFEALAHRLLAIRGNFSTNDVRLPTRSVDDREASVIERLANIYFDVAGKRASVWGGGVREYRQPFAAFVDIVWPLTGAGAAPTNEALEERLRLNAPISHKIEK